MRRTIIIFLFFAFGSFSFAQKIVPKHTFNVELGLPVSMGNKPFKDVMQGLASVSIYQQYSFPFHLNLGLGVKYSLFTIDEFAVQSPVRGQIHTGAVFGKIGWDMFHSERFATDFGVKVGYSLNYSSTDLNKAAENNPRQIEALLVEPTLGLILTADERNSYRFNIGYCIQGYGFSMSTIGLPNNAGGYDPEVYKDVTQYLFVGFGYTFYFGIKVSE